MTGMIVGGWEFVYAAYAITAVTLTLYAASVVVRYRREQRNATSEGES